jgi:hypothetical protein
MTVPATQKMEESYGAHRLAYPSVTNRLGLHAMPSGQNPVGKAIKNHEKI